MWLAALGLSTAACQPSRSVELGSAPDIPAEISLVAALTAGERGELVGSAIRRRGSGRIELARGASPVILVGWPESWFRSDPAGLVVSPSPLCGTRLPEPRWSAELTEDGLLSNLGAALPPLGTERSVTGCEPLGEVVAELECGDRVCVVIPELEDCKLVISRQGDCEGPLTLGRALADGALCVEEGAACQPEPLGANETSAKSAQDQFVCSVPPVSCTVTLRDTPPAGGDFRITRVQAFDGARLSSTGDDPEFGQDTWQIPSMREALRGQPIELVALDTAVLAFGRVRKRPSEPFDDPNQPCRDVSSNVEPTEIAVIDPDSARVVERVEGPSCLTRAVAEPDGRGFAGAYFEGGALKLGRFDAGGHVRSSTVVRVPEPGPRTTVLEIAIVGEPPVVGLLVVDLYSSSPPSFDPTLYLFDLETLQILQGLQLERTQSWWDGVVWLAPLEPESFALLDNDNHRVLGARVGEAVRALGSYTDAPSSIRTLRGVHMSINEERRSAIVSSTSGEVGLYRLDLSGEGPGVRSLVYERDLRPLSSATWPPAPNLSVVALVRWTAGAEPESRLALYDPLEGRLTGGSTSVGTGLVGRMRPDRRGRLWMTMPWSGEVLVVEGAN